MSAMRDFITALEFLTRIRFSNRKDWHEDDFSRSVPYFPLVGLIMGVLMGSINFLLNILMTPVFMRAVLLILVELFIIGALMYDGFMDTADGVFSARNRERCLEIMKDSHVGSNAVIALVCLVLLKVAAFTCIMPLDLTHSLVGLFVTTRTLLVLYVVNYPYARESGLGKMFKEYAKTWYTYLAFIICLLILLALGLKFFYCGIITIVLTQAIAQFLVKQLGGLTGDTYGFLTECGFVIYLLAAVYLL